MVASAIQGCSEQRDDANGLAGLMGINGMSVLLAMRGKYPRVIVVETHPKVLYWALGQKKYNYASAKAEMERVLCEAMLDGRNGQ